MAQKGVFNMYVRTFITFFIIFAWLTGSGLADGTAGRLVAVKGKVWTQAPKDKETRARAGVSLLPGTRIRTGDDGKAEVVFEDGSSVVIQNNTSMVLSGIKRHKKKKTSILIFFGRIWNRVSKVIGKQSHYEVNTPVVVCGVRGTEFETAVGEDGTSWVLVTEGEVNVAGDARDESVVAGQEVEADVEAGLGAKSKTEKEVDWDQWHEKRRDHLRKDGKKLVDHFKRQILDQQAALEELREKQKKIVGLRDDALQRAKAGDPDAVDEVRTYNQELIEIADEIADLGDVAGSRFGLVDHFGTLATDPRFQMIDGKYVEAEAASMRRIKAMFDRMIEEGTDISLEAMEKMLDEMSGGRRGSLKFEKGSSKDDLFGGEN